MNAMAQWTDAQDSWWRRFVTMNREAAEAFEHNVDAQADFTQRWFESMDESFGEEELDEGMEGVFHAYETWMTAATDTAEFFADAMEGEDVSVESLRDLWLNAANESFKEVMRTSAFAAATGRSVERGLDVQGRWEDLNESSLHAAGFPTEGDIAEVGERLVELERRQQAVEDRLVELADAHDSEE
jgi:hypothetical protein